MFIEILGWIFVYLLIGFLTQLAIRLVRGQEVFAGAKYYFWSAVSGPLVLIVWGLAPLIDKYLEKIPEDQ